MTGLTSLFISDIMAKLLLINKETIGSSSYHNYVAVFPFTDEDGAQACVNLSSINGDVFKSEVLHNGHASPDVDYVNANRSIVELSDKEKLIRFQEMITGLMVGLGIEGKVRKKKGYFKVHYDIEEPENMAPGKVRCDSCGGIFRIGGAGRIHIPDEDLHFCGKQCYHRPKSRKCGTAENPHLIPHSGERCAVCGISKLDVRSGVYIYDGAGTGFSNRNYLRVKEALKKRGGKSP
jgi:hypothetical protein